MVGITIALPLGSDAFLFTRSLWNRNLRSIAMSDYLDLYDYRCRVAAMYGERTRATTAGEAAAVILQRFRAARTDLFAHRAQSALEEEQLRSFRCMNYFAYNRALCGIAA